MESSILNDSGTDQPDLIENIGFDVRSQPSGVLSIRVTSNNLSDYDENVFTGIGKIAFPKLFNDGMNTYILSFSEIVNLTANLTLLCPSGSTFGCRNNILSRYYIFVILDHTGAIDVATCRIKLPEDKLYTTIAVSTGSDLSYELYSNAVYTDCVIRCIGQFDLQDAVAGVHDSEVVNVLAGKRSQLPLQVIYIKTSDNAGASLADNNASKKSFSNIVKDDYSLFVGSDEIYMPCAGCEVNVNGLVSLATTTGFNGTNETFYTVVFCTGDTGIYNYTYPSATGAPKTCTFARNFVNSAKGNLMYIEVYQNSGGAINYASTDSGFNRLNATITIP